MSGNVVNDNSDVYYAGHYWNDLKVVRDVLNRRVSGDPERTWSEHFAERAGRPFKRALILNCGNGHVERGLVSDGLVEEAVGIDYSHDLLDQARRRPPRPACRCATTRWTSTPWRSPRSPTTWS